MLTWSGLRGSIALLLAIRMNDDELYDSIAPLACGCVAFTVLVTNFCHTFTATTVATELNFTQLSSTKKKRIELLIENMNGFIKSIREAYVNTQACFWNEVLWQKVEELSTLQHMESDDEEQDHSFMIREERSSKVAQKQKPRETKSEENRTEVETTSRLVIMDIMSAYTQTLGDKQILSNKAVRYMINAIDEAMDRRTALDVDQLYVQVQPSHFARKLSLLLTNAITKKMDNFFKRHQTLRNWLLESVEKPTSLYLWHFIWHVLILVHSSVLLYCFRQKSIDYDYHLLLHFQCVLCLLFCAEILIRRRIEGDDYHKSGTLWGFYDSTRFVFYLCSVFCIYYISQHCSDETRRPTASPDGGHQLHSGGAIQEMVGSLLGSFAWLQHKPECRILLYVNAVSLFELCYMPFWLFYLLPKVVVGQLQTGVAEADHLCLELMHSVILLSERVMEELEKASSAVVLGSERIREKLEAENLDMNRRASVRMIEVLNSQQQNSRWIVYIKTIQVSQMLLCEAKSVVEKEFTMGDIDKDICRILQRKLKDKAQKINQVLEHHITEPELSECLKYVPWISRSSERSAIVKFICQNAIQQTFKIGEYLMRQDELANGAYFLKRGICRFEIKLPQETKAQKKHLLYAGQFTGEKAFLSAGLDPKKPFLAPKRSGSIYAETYVVAYFLKAEHALEILRIDPTIGNQFEETDVLNKCRDFLRHVQPFSNWTIPALDKLIRRNCVIFDQNDKTSKIKEGSCLVLIKGSFTVGKENIIVTTTPKKVDGPYEPILVHAEAARRCFVLEVFQDYIVQQEKDRQLQQAQSKVAEALGDFTTDMVSSMAQQSIRPMDEGSKRH